MFAYTDRYKEWRLGHHGWVNAERLRRLALCYVMKEDRKKKPEVEELVGEAMLAHSGS